MSHHILIVCGYGCHLVPELKGYLDRVIEFCNKHQPKWILLSGGYTQKKSAPGISEAHLMLDYVQPKLTYYPGMMFIDDDSYTSPDNIERAVRRIRSYNPKCLEGDLILTVFCEATRALKIDLLVRHFFGRRADIETASWERMAPTKQIISTLYDLAAIKIPLLARYWRWLRIRKSYRV
jgi:hypothetical protein